MTWELNTKGKIKVIDPEDSPDFADAMMYFVWKDKKELVFAVG